MGMEREVNAQCYHPCIMQFIKTFQDNKNVYFLTEFLGGGDLFYAIREIGNLTKPQTQYYGGSITLALEYLHGRSIMYRDLKPENVLLDLKGNAKLVDFGCCKIALRTNTLVGTPEYFAPETILGKGYTLAIDWWALGVMMHEFIVGPLPFGRETEDQLELFREILEAPLQFPNYITDDTAISLVNGFLERTPELRLGASKQSAKEIKEHSYFAKFDWDGLAGRAIKVPWAPNLKKLQQSWEPCNGEAIEEGESDSKTEAGMEWAIPF
jgi:cGMP-dependent protein kinase